MDTDEHEEIFSARKIEIRAVHEIMAEWTPQKFRADEVARIEIILATDETRIEHG